MRTTIASCWLTLHRTFHWITYPAILETVPCCIQLKILLIRIALFYMLVVSNNVIMRVLGQINLFLYHGQVFDSIGTHHGPWVHNSSSCLGVEDQKHGLGKWLQKRLGREVHSYSQRIVDTQNCRSAYLKSEKTKRRQYLLIPRSIVNVISRVMYISCSIFPSLAQWHNA